MGGSILNQIQNIERHISKEVDVINLPDYYREEEIFFERARVTEEINDIVHYRNMRQDFAYKVYYFLIVWCVCLLFLLLAQATCDTFHLSDPILIVLCGGTTISTVGLVGFVVQGLFNHRHK